MTYCVSLACASSLLHCAGQLYKFIGVALTSSSNFFINYVVFQVRPWGMQ